jgi:ABC-type Fe3+-hydroxamate transport system substrate-binding protein
MIFSIDQLGREVHLDKAPSRIVSLVPSQTEYLFSLGLEGRVVGITKFCVHPESWFRSLTRVGGTKNLDLDAIRKLNPDLILANKEENTKDQVEWLAKDFPVWTSNIETYQEAVSMMTEVGRLVHKEKEASRIVEQIENELAAYQQPSAPVKVAYLVWQNPLYTISGSTFINDWLRMLGMENVFASRTDARYPLVTIEQIAEAKPDLLLLASEPFPFKKEHSDAFAAQLPGIIPVLVDGQMLSWYGSRMTLAPKAIQYLVKRPISNTNGVK